MEILCLTVLCYFSGPYTFRSGARHDAQLWFYSQEKKCFDTISGSVVQVPFTDISTGETIPCYYSVEAKNQQQVDFQHTLPIVHLNVDTVTILWHLRKTRHHICDKLVTHSDTPSFYMRSKGTRYSGLFSDEIRIINRMDQLQKIIRFMRESILRIITGWEMDQFEEVSSLS